jgi:GntR family transcriptional regulator, transcriptional repressor for pyruvate dehydrogenase complex
VSDADLRPIPRSPLYEQVADRLRAFIDAQQLQPGDRLMAERELSARLGVSRTSVRQALTALKVQGLVEIRHGEGVFLSREPRDVIPTLASEIAGSEVDHPMIWEVREGIEAQAARLAAARRDDGDLRAMRAALDEMAASIAAGDDGIEGDRHFHLAVVAAARNPLLSKLMAELAELVDRTSEASLTHAGRPTVSLEGHRAILDAIASGDGDAAAERMRAHVETSREVISTPEAG